MTVAADRFGGLQVVLDLREVCVRIAIIHERVEVFHRLPDAHLAAVQRPVFAAFGEREIPGLVGMVQAIELPDDRRRIVVNPEVFFFLPGCVALTYEIIPITQRWKRTAHSSILTLILSEVNGFVTLRRRSMFIPFL